MSAGSDVPASSSLATPQHAFTQPGRRNARGVPMQATTLFIAGWNQSTWSAGASSCEATGRGRTVRTARATGREQHACTAPAAQLVSRSLPRCGTASRSPISRMTAGDVPPPLPRRLTVPHLSPRKVHAAAWRGFQSSARACACAGGGGCAFSSTSSASSSAPFSKGWTCAHRHGGAAPGGASTPSGCCSRTACGRPPAACQRRSGAAGRAGCPPCPGSWP